MQEGFLLSLRIFKLNLKIHLIGNEFKWRVTELRVCGRNYFKLSGCKNFTQFRHLKRVTNTNV
jgi:hypothetical protein